MNEWVAGWKMRRRDRHSPVSFSLSFRMGLDASMLRLFVVLAAKTMHTPKHVETSTTQPQEALSSPIQQEHPRSPEIEARPTGGPGTI